MGKMIYAGPATFDRNGAAHQGAASGAVDGGGQFIAPKLVEQPDGALAARRPAPAELTPEIAPSVDADAPVETVPVTASERPHPWDAIADSLADQDAFYRAADKAGTNDRSDVTSGSGNSRFNFTEAADAEAADRAAGNTADTRFESVDIAPEVLLDMVHNALPEFRDDIVEAEEPVLWADGRYGALVTLKVGDPDGHFLEYNDHPNHAETYSPESNYEYVMKYYNRGLTRVHVHFDDPR